LEEKIGERLKIQPLDDTADFIDLELWKMDDTQRNERFIQQMKESYPDFSQFTQKPFLPSATDKTWIPIDTNVFSKASGETLWLISISNINVGSIFPESWSYSG
jgi:hypothetical protein